MGDLRILVNNAGVQHRVPMLELDPADWDRVIRTNLTSAFLVGREAARRMIPRGRGKIINVASVQADLARPTIGAYTASKGGIHMMMQTLAQEVAPDRIRVNAVAPGAIRTPINRNAWETEGALERLLRLIPYGRIGEPEDVARAVAWLSSDEADYVTGTTLFVDGGMTLYPGFEDNG